MKKVLFLTTALIMSTMMWAAGTTVDIIEAAGITESVTLNDDNNPYQMGETPITLTGIKGSGNFPALNYNSTKGVDLRFYKGTTCGVTFEADGNTITKIEFLKNATTASNLGSSFSANVGTLTGNIWEGEATSVTLTYAADGTFKEQMYIINVTYTGEAPAERVLTSIYIDGTATKLEYKVGEEFDHAGLKVMGVYDDELGDAEITSGITWSYNPEVFALGNTSVDVTAQYKDFTSKVFTVNNIVVTEKPAPVGIAYTKVTDVATLADGDVIVLVSGEDAYGVAPDGKTFINAKAIDGVEATLVEGVLTAEDAYELTLSKSDDNWTMVGADGTVGTKAAKAFTFGNESVTNTWSISISEGNAIIASTNPDYGTIQYNASNPRFVNYTSTQKAIQIYKKANSPTAMPEVMENANVSKQLINGQLIIIRDNVRYNVAGQQL